MSARGSVLEMVEIAEEQDFRTLDKGGGTLMVYAPPGRAIPGYEMVAIHLPRSDGGNALQVIRSNLRRAGVKFPEDVARERIRIVQTQAQKMTQPSPPKSPSHSLKPSAAEADPLETLLAICNKQADLAAQAAGLIEQIRKSTKDKIARAEQIVAAQELLQKAAQGQW